MVLVNVVRRTGFDFANEVGYRFVGLQANEYVRVIRHAMYGNKFLSLVRYDAGDVTMKFFFAVGEDEALAAFDGKDEVNVDLRKRIGQGCRSYGAWGLPGLLSYRHAAPTGLMLQVEVRRKRAKEESAIA